MEIKGFDLNAFRDADKTFSWRKAGTALIFFVFAYACLGFLHTHGFDELPPAYMGIIGGVFALYFFRKRIDTSGVSKNVDKSVE